MLNPERQRVIHHKQKAKKQGCIVLIMMSFIRNLHAVSLTSVFSFIPLTSVHRRINDDKRIAEDRMKILNLPNLVEGLPVGTVYC